MRSSEHEVEIIGLVMDLFEGCWAHSAQEWFRIEEDGIHAGSLQRPLT